MVEITSLRNPLIKLIRSLKHRKYRRKEECFWAEGTRLVMEALEQNWDIEVLVWSPDLLQNDQSQEAVTYAHVKKVSVSEQVFYGISGRDNPPGLGAVIRIPERNLTDLVVGTDTLLVVLEEPHDPGNVGTVVRTVACAGGNGVILLGDATDPYDPQSVRASAAALLALPVVSCVNIADFMTWSKAQNLRLIGTAPEGKHSYRDIAYQRPLALLLGNEQNGLSDVLWEAADDMVRIPVKERTDSLNLSAAAAITVYQAISSFEDPHPETLTTKSPVKKGIVPR